MNWLLHKLDSMAGAAFGGVLAAVASQGQAFANAYLQRLGGRLDEAADLLAQAREGTLMAEANAASRTALIGDLEARVAALTAMRARLMETGELARPFVLLWEVDTAIAAATLESFTPALPLTVGTAVHALVGLILGLLLWEACKAPAIPLRRRRARRTARQAAARMTRRRGRPDVPAAGAARRDGEQSSH